MTPEEFTWLIKSSKPAAFAERVASLTDKERRSLSKTAADLLTACRKKERADNWGMAGKEGGPTRLAVLGVCPWSKAQQVRCRDLRFADHSREWQNSRFINAAVQILIDRKPDWADKWLERQLDGDSWEVPWEAVKQLVSSGTCRRPTDNDGYIRIIAGQGAGLDFDADPRLLEQDVWRLFEVETFVFHDFPDPKEIDREAWAASPRDNSGRMWQGLWPRILYHFASTGRIDRGRLIDATLQALWRDFKAPAKGGLVKFHGLLEPTPEELADRQTAYIELLRNTHGPSVNLALKTIESLNKLGRVDVSAAMAQLPDIFHLGSKAQPKKAVRLIEKLVGKDADRAAEALPVLGTAFSHESPDVHEAAVKLLEKWKGQFEDLPLDQLADASALVNPTLQGRFVELIGESGAAVESHATATTDDGDLNQRQADLLESIQSLPSGLAERCGLNGAESCLETLTLPVPFAPDPSFPVLSGVEAIEPIASVDELIDEVAHVLEIVESPEQIERILDGVIRLGGEDLAPHTGRLAGIRQQLEDMSRAQERGLIVQVMAVPGVRRMLRTWLGISKSRGEPGGVSVFEPKVQQLLRGFEVRCGELVRRFSGNQFGPMLSLPTHRGGWIDPREFVRRLVELSAGGVAPGKMDLIYGLLRLAPDSRDAALADAAELGEPWGRCVRYALGGDERPDRSDADSEAVWMAAGRARNPFGQLDELSDFNIDLEWPDGVVPAQYVIHSEVDPPDPAAAWDPNRKLPHYVSVEPEPKQTKASRLLSAVKLTRTREPGHNHPTVTLALCGGGTMRYWWVPDWIYECLTTIWPARPDACYAMACNQLIQRLNQTGSTFEPNWHLLHPLLQPDRGWSPLACTALWFGLLGRDENARGLSLDALIEGIQDGRAHPQPLARALCDIRPGWIKLNRLAAGLQEAARTGPLAELVVAEVLDRLIGSWDKLSRDAHHVLALQLEVLTKLRHSPSDAARELLAGVKGSGKSAKLAKQISSLETGDGSERRAAVLQALEGRLRRAERVARQSPTRTEQEVS